MDVTLYPMVSMRFLFYYEQLFSFVIEIFHLFRFATITPLLNQIEAATARQVNFMDFEVGLFATESKCFLK